MAEKEYIEREAVLDLLTDRDVVANPHDEVAFIREDVECLPPADVRPVVFCRNCKYGQGEKMDFWNEYEGIECIGGVVHRKDWFCADGEKREES